jgi:tetratricopeptide (TPR) repeat protein
MKSIGQTERRALWIRFGASLMLASLAGNAHAAPLRPAEPRPALPSAAAQSDPTPSEAAYLRGLEALASGRAADAELAMRESLELDPGQYAAMLGLAELAFQRGDLAAAERLIRGAIAAAPRSAHAHASLGRHLAMQGQSEEAETSLLEAAQLDARLLRPRIDLADLYATTLGRPQLAADYYRQAIALQPDHAGAHYGLGLVLERLGEPAEAARELAAAARLEPGNPLPPVATARLHLRQRDLGAALEAADRALGIAPEFADALELRGDILVASGEFQAASAAYDLMIASRPGHAPAYLKAAMARQQAGDTQRATRDYLAALEINSELAVAYNNLAWMAVETNGDLEQAEAWARRAVALAPQQPSFLDTLGWTYRARGRLAEAASTLSAAAQLTGSGPGTHYRLGTVRLEQGDKEGAEAAFRRALEMQPDHAPALAGLEALR